VDAPAMVEQLVGTVLNELEDLAAAITPLDGGSLEVMVLLDQPRCFAVGSERLFRH
jgi:hypothetical protein